MMKFKLSLLAATAWLAACATGPEPIGGSPDIMVTSLGELPPPAQADYEVGSRDYLIGPFDKLEIDVFGVEELGRKVQADAGGQISMPLAGTIDAAGKTPRQLADEIERRLRDGYVKDPHVSVNLLETVSQVVTVSGAVEKPGLYPVMGKMTLMRAVAGAAGATEFSDLNDVVVFREVNGQQMAALYNLEAIQRGAYNDPEIYANDVIVVGESETRRLLKDVFQIVPRLLNPLVLLIR